MKSYVPLHYVPIEDDGYHLQVTASVNGNSVRLVVDSGASRTVFDLNRIHRLGETNHRSLNNLQAHGLGEEINSYLLSCDTLHLAGKKLTDYNCVLVDLLPMNELFRPLNAPAISGILGGDLLAAMNGIINYRKNTLKLAGKNYPLGVLAFDDGSFHLSVQLEMNGKSAFFLLDTGASKTVFDLNTFESFQPYDIDELIPNEKPSSGIHIETTEHSTILLDKISFGYLALPETEILLLDLSNINYTYSLLNLPPVDGILGNDLLRVLGATINYKKKFLRLKD